MHASLEVQDTPLSGSCNEFGGVGELCCDHAEAALGDVTKSSTTIVHPAIAETVRSLAPPVPDPQRGARRLGSRLAFCAQVMNIAPDPHLPQADSAASMRDDNFSIPPREGAMRHWRCRNDREGAAAERPGRRPETGGSVQLPQLARCISLGRNGVPVCPIRRQLDDGRTTAAQLWTHAAVEVVGPPS